MRKIINRNNKGITLIALVITIIVLLILAGVAISMLSGENGILKQAANAKIEYEEAEQKEQTTLTDMEVLSDFSINNTPYKCRNGYITGVIVNETTAETVKEFSDRLPNNYSVINFDESEITDLEGTRVSTGMIVKKGNNKVGTIIVYGDISLNSEEIQSDGSIDATDSTLIDFLVYYPDDPFNFEEYELIAMDVNHDNIINIQDSKIIDDITFYSSGYIIDQDVYAPDFDDIKIEYEE